MWLRLIITSIFIVVTTVINLLSMQVPSMTSGNEYYLAVNVCESPAYSSYLNADTTCLIESTINVLYLLFIDPLHPDKSFLSIPSLASESEYPP